MADTAPFPRAILITGASSGIGEALALAYAGPGAFVALSGRDGARLEAVAAACRSQGAEVAAEVVDVTERAAMAAWIGGVDGRRPLDLVIANAGIAGSGAGAGSDEADRVRAIFAVNLDGVLNTVLPVIAAMRARGGGQIALMSSLAGLHGMPGAPAYSASKAAVKAYAEGLRGRLAGDGIRVSAICPGFVESRITEGNPFPMPLLMSADKAAGIIKRGLARDKALIAFPWPLYAAMRLLGMLPPGLADALLRRLPRKE